MSDTKTAETFGNETHDNCEDDARTQQNRSRTPVTDDARDIRDNAEQRSRAKPSDQPPTRDAGASKP
jgi:hypothetical protein